MIYSISILIKWSLGARTKAFASVKFLYVILAYALFHTCVLVTNRKLSVAATYVQENSLGI